MDSTRPGHVLAGRYRLTDLLSEAREGRFWKAHDTVLDRPVAVHVLAEDDPRAPLLLDAARSSATVNDQHLLRVLDADERDGSVYIVNEWGSGTSLDVLLGSGGPIAPRRAAWVAGEVADTIAVAHAAGAAHGRLNPENVLLGVDGAVHVIGFAVEAALLGLSGDRRGVDLVDLAGLLYAMLTGRWAGESSSSVAPAPVDRGRVLRPRQVRAGVPRVLDDLCDSVLGGTTIPAAEFAVRMREYVGNASDLSTGVLLGTIAPSYAEPSDASSDRPLLAVPPGFGRLLTQHGGTDKPTDTAATGERTTVTEPEPEASVDTTSGNGVAPARETPGNETPGNETPGNEAPGNEATGSEATGAGDAGHSAAGIAGIAGGIAAGGIAGALIEGANHRSAHPDEGPSEDSADGPSAAPSAAPGERDSPDDAERPQDSEDTVEPDSAAPPSDPAKPRAREDTGEVTVAGLPTFDDTGGDGAPWFAPRPGPPSPPPQLEEPPERPLFTDEPRQPRYPEQTGADTSDSGSWIFSSPTVNIAEEPREPVPGRRWFRLALGVAICVLLVIGAVIGVHALQNNAAPGPAPATTAGGHSPSPSPTATPTPITGIQARDFDPEGHPPVEYSELVHYAIDGNPATVWHTSSYDDQIGNGPRALKTGVGLVIDLGSSYDIGAVNVTVSPGAPTTMSLYASNTNPVGPPQGRPAATVTGAGRITIHPAHATGRYLTIWLTALPRGSDGFYEGVIAEVSVTGVAAS